MVPTVATTVPLEAVALTRVRLAGSTSVNSSPGLSGCAAGSRVGEDDRVGDGTAGVNVPLTVLVPVTVTGEATVKLVGSAAPPTPGSSVRTVDSLLPLLSASKLAVP